MSRRSAKLFSENEPERVWRLRLADGSVREPLNHLHIAALVETGVASGESEISAVGAESWHRLAEHPIWSAMAPTASIARLTVPAAADPGVIPVEVHAATSKMQAVWDEQREITKARMLGKAALEDRGRFLQAMGYASAIGCLICVGDLIMFTCGVVTAFVFLVALVRLVALALVWRVLR